MIELADIRAATGAQLYGDVIAGQFLSLCVDPSHVQRGDLFITLPRNHVDSQRQVELALQRGAVGLLCVDPPRIDTSGVTVLIVGDTISAIGQWAAYILRQYGPRVVAVTGSLGKSGTLAAIEAVLGTQYNVYFDLDMEPGRVGLPISLQGLSPNHEVVLVELAAENPGEIHDLAAIVQPDILVITSLLPSGNASSSPLSEKDLRDLVETVPSEGGIVLNYDDPVVRGLAQYARASVLTFGFPAGDFATGADFLAYSVVHQIDKSLFSLKVGEERIKGLYVPLIGYAGLSSALAGIAVGAQFGIGTYESLERIRNALPLPGRLTRFDGRDGYTIIDHTYNARPESALAALQWLAVSRPPESKLMVILGGLSGGKGLSYRDLAEALNREADWLVIFGDASFEQIGNEIADHVPVYRTFRHADNLTVVEKVVQDVDIVLIIGGKDAHLERTVRQMLDEDVSSDWLARHSLKKERVRCPPGSASWIEVDLGTINSNLAQITARLKGRASVLAMIPANAYGHGAVMVGATALLNGAVMLGVGSLGEGIAIRQAGIDGPVLVLGHASIEDISLALNYDLHLSIYSPEIAEAIRLAAGSNAGIARVHLYVDTGLGGPGLHPDEVIGVARMLLRSETVKVEGIFTQFAVANDPVQMAYSNAQLKIFQGVVRSLTAAGVKFNYVHAANSAALLDIRESILDLVRPGLLLYGLNPSTIVSAPEGIRQLLTWKTTVSQVKTLPPGSNIGYGKGFTTDTEEKVAIIPVGYADSFPGSARHWGEVLIQEQRAPLLSRPGMHYSTVRVSGIPDVLPGDEVVLLGQQGRGQISVEDVALRLGISNYEVVSRIPSHIPRVPFDSQDQVAL